MTYVPGLNLMGGRQENQRQQSRAVNRGRDNKAARAQVLLPLAGLGGSNGQGDDVECEW